MIPPKTALLLLLVFGTAGVAAGAETWQTLTPPPDNRKILRNGPQGIAYEIEELLPADHLPEWVERACSVIYWRLDWAEVCDADGRPRFAELDREIFEGYRKRGFKLAFRIMATNQSTSARDVVPRAVIERFGIPTIERPTRHGAGQRAVIWWSPQFIAAHEELIAAFGRWFDGQPWAAQAELGSIGEWGEMHLGGWGATTLAAHGWDNTTFYRTVTACMDQFERHLPRTPRAFCWAPIFHAEPDPDFAHLLQRALRRGWWLRSDGLDNDGPAPFVLLAHAPHARQLALIGEGSARGAETADDLARWFQHNVGGGVSLLNPMGTKRLCARYPEVAEHYATRLGPRLAVARADVQLAAPRHGRPPRLLLQLVFRQDGNAPLFQADSLRIRLRSEAGILLTHAFLPEHPLAALAPGESCRTRLVLELRHRQPADAPLELQLQLLDQARHPLELPHPGQTADGWLPLGLIDARLVDASSAIRLLYSADRDGVQSPAGLAVEATPDGVHFASTGPVTESVLIASSAPLPVRPDALYLAHARYRATALGPAHAAFFHWLDFRGEDDHLTTFLSSPAYDGAGSWQSGTITHRPRPNDRTLRALFLGKNVRAIDADAAGWIIEEILFPSP